MFSQNISTNASNPKSNNTSNANVPTSDTAPVKSDKLYDDTSSESEEEDDLDNDLTSLCSSVSSITDDEQHLDLDLDTLEQSQLPLKKKKSRFNVSKAKPTTPVTNVTKEAVSISFLGSPKASSRPTNAKQVIQRALASLRPGGIFFVLDYKEEEQNSAGAQSRAMKEIPPDLLQHWNLTMVPSDLETFYNTQLATKTAKPAPKRTALPAAKRVVRWMGVKPTGRVGATY